MALKFIEFSNGSAVIESDSGGPRDWSPAIEELLQPSTKEFAITEAVKKGVSGPACGIVGGAYPVDKSGAVVAPNMDPATIVGYRIDVPIASTFR